jgi:thiaminase (transcriptional activator TenA)
MTPCMRLYAHLGQSLAVEGVAADSSYGSWVTAYADPAFGILADQLEALLDAHATDTPAVRAAYSRAMRLELAFFDAAYSLTPRQPR